MKPKAQSKKRLSIFSFGEKVLSPRAQLGEGSSSSTVEGGETHDESVKVRSGPDLGTSPDDNFSTSDTASNESSQLSHSFLEHPESHIFERSVQDSIFEPTADFNSPSNRRRSRSQTQNSFSSGQFLKSEDYIPPALDATTSLFIDKNTNLDEIEMIYSKRRNSSVIGLNMALGRPFTPSRKNSTFSIHQLANINTNINNNTSGYPQQVQSPVSPPKLAGSQSSLNFYSYADMINNDEFAKRPAFKSSYSHGFIPSMKSQSFSGPSGQANNQPSTKHSSFIKHRNQSSQLSKELLGATPTPSSVKPKLASFKSKNHQSNSSQPSPAKFLVSPESSDSEDHSQSNKRKSIGSATSAYNPPPSMANLTFSDNESLISTSIGDCIRQTTTEINGH